MKNRILKMGEFVENQLSKNEKRNIIGRGGRNNNPIPAPGELDENGNPLGNSTNGDGSNGDLPPQDTSTTSGN